MNTFFSITDFFPYLKVEVHDKIEIPKILRKSSMFKSNCNNMIKLKNSFKLGKIFGILLFCSMLGYISLSLSPS